MVDNSFDQACAYRFIDGADKDKYGSFLQQLKSQCGLRNDQYPAKLAQVLDALSTHQWDPAYKEKQKQKKANQKPNGNNNNNNNSNKNGNNFAQKKGNKLMCFCCGKEDHSSQDCTLQDTFPRNQSFIKKTP